MIFLRSAFALLFASTLFGCAGYSVQSTTMPHPAYTAGAIAQNRVSHDFARAERSHGLPEGALADEASLVRMDPQGLCFTVTLRDLAGSEHTMLHNYTIEVVDAEREPLLVGPTIEGFQQQVGQYNGLVTETYNAGSSTECVARDERTGECNRWEDRPITNYRSVPGLVEVATGAGLVCFSNDGKVNPQTQEISLVLWPNRSRGIGFRWEFFMPQQAPTQFSMR